MLKKLATHRLINRLNKEVSEIHAKVQERKWRGSKTAEKQAYLFYTLSLYYTLHELIGILEQLDHCVEQLRDNLYYQQAEVKDVKAANYIIFNVDNFVLRVSNIQQIILKAVNTTFQIGLQEEQLSYEFIIHNRNLQQSKIPKILNRLQKSAQAIRRQRHQIAYRSSYLDSDTKKIKLFSFFDKDGIQTDKPGKKFTPLPTKNLAPFIDETAAGFAKHNKLLARQLDQLLNELYRHYQWQAARLKPTISDKT